MRLPRISKYSFAACVILLNIISIVKSDLDTKYQIVETKNGKVRGVRETTLIQKVDYYSFKGIPYAKSPTKELRFLPPKPVESWAPTILDALEHGSHCVQPIHFGEMPKDESEDCLFLNVYTPADVKPDEKLAVLVFVHGGAYAMGSGNSDSTGPDFLIDQRVILVTMNYRLGVLGFMSLGTPEYSGNMGLKDQQMALRWIHSNIEHFSGDNKRVTLFGESAGSGSVHFHVFSSESRKYFRNVIPMSGSVDDYWTSYGDRDHLNLAFKIAGDLGEPKQSLDELVNFLKTVPAEKISTYGDDHGLKLRSETTFSPVIEKKNALQPFINDWPSNIYNKSEINVNAMFSYCSAEFILFYGLMSPIDDLVEINRNFSLALPFRGIDLPFDSPKNQQLLKEVREFYFGNATIDENTLKPYLDLLTDANFAYGIDKSARQHATRSPSKTFYFRFDIDSKLNAIKRQSLAKHLPGAAHSDDICYVFRCKHLQETYDEILLSKNDEESKVCLRGIENMSKMFANFAKYDEPTHDGVPINGFLPIRGDEVNFLDVTNDGLKPGVNPNQERNALWSYIEKEVTQNEPNAGHRLQNEIPEFVRKTLQLESSK